jgi:hypothetical protein
MYSIPLYSETCQGKNRLMPVGHRWDDNFDQRYRIWTGFKWLKVESLCELFFSTEMKVRVPINEYLHHMSHDKHFKGCVPSSKLTKCNGKHKDSSCTL